MVKEISVWLWQLPRHLLASLIWAAFGAAGRVAKVEKDGTLPVNVFITIRVKSFGMSMGRYIFLDEGYSAITRKHERGHSWQSLITGPFYLLVIGLPSAVGNNLWDRLFHKGWTAERRNKWYYSRYPEEDADLFGGVRRS